MLDDFATTGSGEGDRLGSRVGVRAFPGVTIRLKANAPRATGREPVGGKWAAGLVRYASVSAEPIKT